LSVICYALIGPGPFLEKNVDDRLIAVLVG
jgi:hypothetical protein